MGLFYNGGPENLATSYTLGIFSDLKATIVTKISSFLSIIIDKLLLFERAFYNTYLL